MKILCLSHAILGSLFLSMLIALSQNFPERLPCWPMLTFGQQLKKEVH